MPVADRKSFKRTEVSKGDAIAIRKAGRKNLMSDRASALDSFSGSTMEKRMDTAIVAPAILKRKPIGKLLPDSLLCVFRNDRSFYGRH